uniref:Uncharacterized protein n=1 Tax=Rhizophora mucronata TaxID=61149 RepID=A0A2P2Q645_RHIMU
MLGMLQVCLQNASFLLKFTPLNCCTKLIMVIRLVFKVLFQTQYLQIIWRMTKVGRSNPSSSFEINLRNIYIF